MMAAAKAKAEEAKARALANAAIIEQRQRQAQQQQQQQQVQQLASAGTTRAAGGAGALSQLELIRQKKEALQAKLSKALPVSATAATPASGSRSGIAAPPAVAVSDPKARGGLGVDMSSMISRDAEGNLIINSVTSGKPVKAPSFATAKVTKTAYPTTRKSGKYCRRRIYLPVFFFVFVFLCVCF